ncbi:trypsin-like peptidase domain-containing protein [Knoellia sp. p5-6-4]|uniref:trypsin-like peptidase domain-containing protein n=1 Tax=unclassified Knoellia TaxID=2618719 RepID=UPI0023DB4255|nr:trypsin-like peptidase domain-containing protein [Knoellia sp. p5-6-4]MDF2145364.1 trypsin-like peptidase domain-containing protein [Knoellia sp. p5-6-4]
MTLAVLVGSASAGLAHTHPTPIERAAPAVVFVEARAKVEVALIEHRTSPDAAGVHIGVAQTTWNPVLATASGFVVDPNGAIVTTGAVVKPDLERAKVYAVNQAFSKHYGQQSLAADPFARHDIGPASDRNQQRLQGCYPPHRINDAGGCIVKATLDMVVYPYVSSQQRYGNLRAEVLSGSKDVAVLRVRGANGWPTVRVAQSAAGASALGVLGFTGVPSAKYPLREVNQHLAKPGAAELKTEELTADDVKDAATLKQALGEGLAGGPVVAESGQVVGLMTGPPRAGAAAPDLVGVSAILPVLKAAGVSPHAAGTVDTTYEKAMHFFKNSEYSRAIPFFRETLEAFPGHYGARANLAISEQYLKVGGGQGASGSGTVADDPAAAATFPWLLVAGVALATLVLAVVALLLARRRRSRASRNEAAAAAPTASRDPVAVGVAHAPSSRGSSAATSSRAGPAPAAPSRAGAAPARSGSAAARPATPGPRTGGGREPSVHPGAGPATGQRRADAAASHPDHQGVPAAAARSGPAQPSRPVDRGPQASVAPRPPQVSAAAAGTPAPTGQASASPSTVSGQRFCTSCGGRLASQHQFCGWCGEPVS